MEAKLSGVIKIRLKYLGSREEPHDVTIESSGEEMMKNGKPISQTFSSKFLSFIAVHWCDMQSNALRENGEFRYL
jgi:hypothetical protein